MTTDKQAEPRWTPEPWSSGAGLDLERGTYAEVFVGSGLSYRTLMATLWDEDNPPRDVREEEHNVMRAVACVNALAGLNPEAVREVVEAAERAALFIAGTPPVCPERGHLTHTEVVDDIRTALAKLRGEV